MLKMLGETIDMGASSSALILPRATSGMPNELPLGLTVLAMWLSNAVSFA
eukprot:CAMPEP_0182841112 /NCGR_PEP_ID=MMETSP0006_2-20121128/24843_1 /TAXON_ID=97485 /ORGANISM="Prymnesium parvum, Strain Texoma1" /LENGTH=49 /DNA_ID=CAMNT_0024970541 /DNA_START=37 /DNA_END=186 /DNA_ORIENTATION=+